MLIEDWRPKMFCKDIECQKPVHRTGFFLEEGYKYYHEDDAGQASFLLRNSSNFQISDRLIKDFS
jgi:hypothetical protein